jgi:VWFA-related protein
MKVIRCLAYVAVLWLALLGRVAAVIAQGNDQGGAQASVVSVDSSQFPTLTLMLSVVDANGQPVRGLTPAAISVREDQTDAEVTSVSDVIDNQQGIAVVLAIDVSGSMAGAPIAAARSAAAAFVDGLGPNDQVAILKFDRQVTPLLNFTSSRDSAKAAIQSLAQTPGGATALYDAAKQSVLMASSSSLSRRMVILLSDGKEYVSNGQNTSLASRADAYTEAEARGVTIHTIGLGADIDADYMRQLAGDTGGIYLAAPTPDQLKAQWDEVATVMRQLVRLQVRSRLSGEGQSHTLTVSVRVGNQTVVAKSMFFSKAVAPQVSIPDLPSQPLQTPTAVTAHVDAPSAVLHVAFSVDGQVLSDVRSAPWQAMLDPMKLVAGPHQLEISATDADGLTGNVAAEFQVAALPPRIALTLTEGQLISQPLSVTPDITAQQGAVKQVTLAIDGQSQDLGAAPYRFELDPAKLTSGVHRLTLTVTDAAGQTTSKDLGFSVPNAPAAVVPAAASAGAAAIPAGLLLGAAAAVIVLAAVAGIVLARRAPGRAAGPRGPRLRVLSGLEKGQVLAITPTRQTIGRLTSAPLHLNDPTGALRLSREHARVWLEDGAAWIEDAGSHAGTFVNGNRIAGRCRLTTGARIKLGEVELAAEGIAAAADDLRATALAPADQTAGAEPLGALGRETVLSDQAIADAAGVRPAVEHAAEGDERQTRLKPAAPEAVDEASRATLLASEPDAESAERQTRLKPADAAAQDAIDQALRSTVLHRPSAPEDEARQTKLKSD